MNVQERNKKYRTSNEGSDNTLIYEGKDLNTYKKVNLAIQESWNQRYFVSKVRTYLNGSSEKILAVGGLRGTGKTVGILQASEGYDILYLLAQKMDGKTGSDYIDILMNTEKEYIVIEEYSWIENRKELDSYLLTSVQNNKRIILTATESIALDFMNYGALNHRVEIMHTTMFTYEEYLKLYNKKHSESVCKEFLLEGGLFKEYTLRNFAATKEYISDAIINNLTGYLKNEMNIEKAKAVTCAVLYKAIYPLNLLPSAILPNNHITLEYFLEKMGVDISYKPEESEIHRIADIFEESGIIVRIPNFNRNSELKEKFYITNPSLSYQLIKEAYGLNDIENSILPHIFESTVAVQLFTNRLSEHDIYFHYDDLDARVNPKLAFIITDREIEYAYIFECDFKEDTVYNSFTNMFSQLENYTFEGIEIDGRYVVYDGNSKVNENYDVGPIIFTPIGDILDYYFEFEHNIEIIKNKKIIL